MTNTTLSLKEQRVRDAYVKMHAETQPISTQPVDENTNLLEYDKQSTESLENSTSQQWLENVKPFTAFDAHI